MASWKDTIKNDSEQPKKSSWKDTIIDESNSDEWKSREPEVSTLESLGRGALQSGTYGFSDEIGSGIVSALTTDPTLPNYLERLKMNYETAREDTRGANKTAEEANPNAYLTGELGAGVATGLMTGGAGAIANLGKVGLKQGWKQLGTQGLTQGAAAGLGSTEADLLKGEIGQASRDTAMGAGLGAGLGVALPTSLNAVGKATSTLGKNIVNKSAGLQDILASYNLAKSGKSVVGKEALDAIESESMDTAEKIVKGLEKQSSTGSDMIGEVLSRNKEKNQDISKILKEAKDKINNSSTLLKEEKERQLSLIGEYEDSITKETIESGKDIAKRDLEKKMRIEESAAPMFGETVSFPDVKETPDALIALRKKLNKEGAEEVSPLIQNIPEDKITKETIDQLKDMNLQDLYNYRKSINESFNESKYGGKKFIKEQTDAIDNLINSMSSDTDQALIKEGKAMMSESYKGADEFKLFDKDASSKSKAIDLQSTLLGKDNSKSMKHLKEALEFAREEFVPTDLKNVATTEYGLRSKLNKQAEGASILNPIVPFIPVPSGKAIGIRGAEAFGTISNSNVVKSTKDFARKMINLDDAALSKLVTKVNPEFGTTLQKALQDVSKKDRLLWSLSQQPAFRQAVEKAEREESTVELPTLDVNTDN